ncbi:MAG: S-layer homology domain-containing protein [Candidatus Peribacteraceae bacterium]|jgi:hypothetical protein
MRLRSVSTVILLSAAFVPLAWATFDELGELKRELVSWQMTHAADLSDLVETLDDMSGPSFTDVQESDWYSSYVASVSAWGIVTGYRDKGGELTGKFGPAEKVTVAEALKMSLEAAQVDEKTCGAAPPSLPAASQHWASAYVSCGEQKDMRLFGEKALNLNRTAKRAEVLSILHDAFGDEIPPYVSRFRDTRGHPLEADVAYATYLGVVSGDRTAQGVDLDTFRPNAPINRAEVAKIIYMRLREDAKRQMSSAN